MIEEIIKIDLQVLEDENLSPTQYCTLYILHEKKKKYLYTVIYPSKEEIKDLLEREYISVNPFDAVEGLDNLPDEVNIFLNTKGIELFSTTKKDNDTKWEEFKQLYPKRDGDRALHDKYDKNKKTFIALIKAEGNSDNIIKGLKNEIKARENARKKGTWFQDWKLMSTWLNNKNYTLYLDYQDTSSNNSKVQGI